MTPNEKMEALCNLSPSVGLRLYRGSWLLHGIEVSDGAIVRMTPFYSGRTPREAIENAWDRCVTMLATNEHVRVGFGDATRRARWDPEILDWREVTLPAVVQPSTPAT